MPSEENENGAPVDPSAVRSAWLDLAGRWGLTVGERRGLVDGEGQLKSRCPDGSTTRTRVLLDIGRRLSLEDDLATREWLRRPMLLFAFATPLDVMAGSMADLLRFRSLVERGLGS